jgi:hypothetical protein
MGFFLRAVVVGLACGAVAFAGPAAPSKTYEQWVAMAEAGDPAVDFTALRQAYVRSPGYDGYGLSWADIRKAFAATGPARDCDKAVALSDGILKADYTYAVAHLMRSVCFGQKGDSVRAEREKFIYRGLLQSVLVSGDGKSPKTAYMVFTMAEERFVLAYFDQREKLQALVMESGHNYDRIDAVDGKTGEAKSVYFNVDAMFGSLTRKFSGDKQE